MQVILHVGAHKTATTTIQNNLDANRDILLENKIVAITAPRLDKSDFNSVPHLFRYKKPTGLSRIFFRRRVKRAAFWNFVKSNYQGRYPNKVVVSEEAFLRPPFDTNSARLVCRGCRYKESISRCHNADIIV